MSMCHTRAVARALSDFLGTVLTDGQLPTQARVPANTDVAEGGEELDHVEESSGH
jgi:hypothetical protein